MSSITYQKINNLPFYSLNQFTQLQPLSRSKSAIYLYQHNQSQQIFVVKQVQFREQALKVYDKIIRLYGVQGLVRIRGVCKMIIKYKADRKNSKRNHQISQQSFMIQKSKYNSQKNHQGDKQNIVKQIYKNKQDQWLLIFMEKCEFNMVEYIQNRRKQRKIFKSQQVNSFISQTLLLLQTLQKQNISHRDIKPQNFLYDKGKFKLCDFQNSIYVDPLLPPEKRFNFDLTTVQYTSPQFFRNLREVKNKMFDPYKLDLYAFGITIMYICSMGKFDLSQRRQYLEQNSVFHSNFIKQQRRKYLKNNDQFKNLSTIAKIMLEQDQYKRDTFVTLLIKIKPMISLRELQINAIQEQVFSQNSKSQQSRRKLSSGAKKINKKNKWEGSSQIHKNLLKSLLILTFSFFMLIMIV